MPFTNIWQIRAPPSLALITMFCNSKNFGEECDWYGTWLKMLEFLLSEVKT